MLNTGFAVVEVKIFAVRYYGINYWNGINYWIIIGTVIPHPLLAVRGTAIPYRYRLLGFQVATSRPKFFTVSITVYGFIFQK